MTRVYLDYNSTTPVDPGVAQAMMTALTEIPGNPSNTHWFGREAKEALERARQQVADLIRAEPDAIFFTGSGTEADNWAIKGIVAASGHTKPHIICSPIEHDAILRTCEFLSSQGVAVSYVEVDETGLVDPGSIEKLICPNTVLVSCMLANNEIGTIQPIPEIAAVCHAHNVLLHTDAVAAAGKIEIDVQRLGADLLTLSAHKIHGPKGIGALYIRPGVNITPLIHGGHQEQGRRAGTVNLAGAVGMGAACELARRNWSTDSGRIRALRDRLEKTIFDRIEEVHLNGHPIHRLPNTLNASIGYIEGEALIAELDIEGIAVTSGSACASGESGPSATLRAIRVPSQFINSPVRFSLGRENTEDELDRTVEVLVQVVARLRAISPIWKDRGSRFFAAPR